MSEKVLLKELLFNSAKVERLAGEIQRVYSTFVREEFLRSVLGKFPELELKARITWIAACLKQYLPSDYKEALDIILRTLPAPNDPSLSDDDFGDFIYAPYAEYVAKNGCTAEYLALSLAALHAITQRFSVEDAIRTFLNAFPKETLVELLKWTQDSHYHVRRLCSEGTRPKLPWAQKIKLSASQPLVLLDSLFADRTRFVTRSVANHMNDISKIDPDLAMDTLLKWQKSGRQQEKEMDYILHHALRTLVKQGDARALNMLGFDEAPQVKFVEFSVPEQVFMNTALEFSFSMQALEDSTVLIDYILYFQNKAGQMNSKKVFKLTKLKLKKGELRVFTKRHLLREKMTTRTLYPGLHEIEIQVNGKKYGKRSFSLLAS